MQDLKNISLHCHYQAPVLFLYTKTNGKWFWRFAPRQFSLSISRCFVKSERNTLLDVVGSEKPTISVTSWRLVLAHVNWMLILRLVELTLPVTDADRFISLTHPSSWNMFGSFFLCFKHSTPQMPCDVVLKRCSDIENKQYSCLAIIFCLIKYINIMRGKKPFMSSVSPLALLKMHSAAIQSSSSARPIQTLLMCGRYEMHIFTNQVAICPAYKLFIY